MIDSVQSDENLDAPQSPLVLKPKPLLLRRKNKRVITPQPLSTWDVNIPPKSGENLGFLTQSPGTYLNPFKCSINKRKRDVDEKENSDLLPSLPPSSKIQKKDSEVYSSPPRSSILVDENAHLGLDEKHFSSDNKQLCKKQKQFPVDWSLKTKIRLISEKAFPWRSNFKTSEEASGTTGFVRCLNSDSHKDYNLDSSHGAKFFQNCLVWIHPSLPWLNLFPRSESSLSSNSPMLSLDIKYLDILHSNWCASFLSLYQLVRTCQCPFFYLCAPTFTVMFRSDGVGSILDIHAAITPTTRGFRNALTEEGIEFTMPLKPNSTKESKSKHKKDSALASKSTGPNNQNVKTDAADDVSSEEDEPGTWLESLGLSQQDFPSLNSRTAKLEREQQQNYDHRPESLIYVNGSGTQALVNFLLNYPSCMSKVGPMAGIPPTLLAPVAFLGATLQSHKIQHAKSRENGIERYIVEMSGPVLPNVVHSLASLLCSTQEGNFSLALTSHQPSLAFARLPHSSSFPPVFATENLKDCGLTSAFIQQMCAKNDELETKEMTNIVAEEGLFTWT